MVDVTGPCRFDVVNFCTVLQHGFLHGHRNADEIFCVHFYASSSPMLHLLLYFLLLVFLFLLFLFI